MAEISKITLPTGSTYDLKDAAARASISAITSAISGGISFIGETTTTLTDGATTTPITINDESVGAIAGRLVVYASKEFLFDGTKWIELGDVTGLGSLAYKNSATMSSFTPQGSISTPTFTGSAMNASGSYTPSGDITLLHSSYTYFIEPNDSQQQDKPIYTPYGEVTAPVISISSAGSTTSIYSITDVGTLPSLTTSVSSETLTISFSQGTLPSRSSGIAVKIGDASYAASSPSFSGVPQNLIVDISLPTAATFSGTSATINVSGTPSGSISTPSFTGTAADIIVS